jgi:hypothetical protein
MKKTIKTASRKLVLRAEAIATLTRSQLAGVDAGGLPVPPQQGHSFFQGCPTFRCQPQPQ